MCSDVTLLNAVKALALFALSYKTVACAPVQVHLNQFVKHRI
jgi:hypothetical protein